MMSELNAISIYCVSEYILCECMCVCIDDFSKIGICNGDVTMDNPCYGFDLFGYKFSSRQNQPRFTTFI